MLDRVPRTLDTREGSVIQTALGPAAWYLEGLYMLLGQVQQNAYANTAAGQSLDYICAERGIRRKEAVAARRKGTFNVQIREGALFKTINGADSVLFMCTGKLLEKTDGSYTYEMVCQTGRTCRKQLFRKYPPGFGHQRAHVGSDRGNYPVGERRRGRWFSEGQVF